MQGNSALLIDKLDSNAEASLRHVIAGALRTQAVHVAAKLGIADQLAFGPRGAKELAERIQVNAGMLARVLRFLVTHGIFIEQADGRFALNPAAEYLQSAHPRSLRPSAIRAGEGLMELGGALLEAVRTGETPHDRVHGATFFNRMAERGKEREFGARMSGSTQDLAAALAAFDSVRAAKTIVDVGGGHGSILSTILQRHAHLRGILLDTAPMVEDARQVLRRARVDDRCESVAGDFFESVPAGDVHLLSWILHDWNDASAGRILQTCRAACNASTTLLIVEAILPERAQAVQAPHPGLLADPFTLDLQMLLLTGGRERMLREYESLLASQGFEITRTSAVTSCRGASAIEARLSRGSGLQRDAAQEV